MADIPADKAELVALFVETLLYGIFVVLFYQSMCILTRKRAESKINWPLVLTSCAIFVTATGHLAIILRRALDAFIDHRNDKGGPLAYYGNLRSALEVSQASFQVAVSFLGDSMAIYRVFVVYDRRYVAIALPMVSLCGTIVASIGSIVTIGEASTRSSAFYFPKLETWMPIFFGLTFCTSVICTGLIAVRLWYLNSRVTTYVVGGKKRRKLITIQRIIIESATMYSAAMFVYLVTYQKKTNYSIIFGDMVAPIIGIVFSLITIRVNEAFNSSGSTLPTNPSSHNPQIHISDREIGLKPVPVDVRMQPSVDSFTDRDGTVVYSKEGRKFHSGNESQSMSSTSI